MPMAPMPTNLVSRRAACRCGDGVVGRCGVAGAEGGGAFVAGVPEWGTVLGPGVPHFAVEPPLVEVAIG